MGRMGELLVLGDHGKLISRRHKMRSYANSRSTPGRNPHSLFILPLSRLSHYRPLSLPSILDFDPKLLSSSSRYPLDPLSRRPQSLDHLPSVAMQSVNLEKGLDPFDLRVSSRLTRTNRKSNISLPEFGIVNPSRLPPNNPEEPSAEQPESPWTGHRVPPVHSRFPRH